MYYNPSMHASAAPAQGSAVVLYSGGTDSTCAAALIAERFSRVHLLTFVERGTESSPIPRGNVSRLREKLGADRFPHRVMRIDGLLRRFSYDRYARAVARHGFFMLSTPGFSALAWHVRAIVYCLENGIRHAADGLTRELMHFPGHMDAVLRHFRALYARFGIDYSSPVRDWPTPPDRRFLDHLIVDRHGFLPPGGEERAKTTGRYLFEAGLMPHPDVKGSPADRGMQHDCYPFVVFNLFAFWLYLGFHGQEDYEDRMASLFGEKAEDASALLDDYRARGSDSVLAGLLEP